MKGIAVENTTGPFSFSAAAARGPQDDLLGELVTKAEVTPINEEVNSAVENFIVKRIVSIREW